MASLGHAQTNDELFPVVSYALDKNGILLDDDAGSGKFGVVPNSLSASQGGDSGRLCSDRTGYFGFCAPTLHEKCKLKKYAQGSACLTKARGSFANLNFDE
jgi:hypothetical protein